MTAKEAKEISDKAYAASGDMSAIYEAIELEAGNGKQFMYYYKTLNILQCKTLEKDGYKVESLPTTPNDNRDIYEIRWD